MCKSFLESIHFLSSSTSFFHSSLNQVDALLSDLPCSRSTNVLSPPNSLPNPTCPFHTFLTISLQYDYWPARNTVCADYLVTMETGTRSYLAPMLKLMVLGWGWPDNSAISPNHNSLTISLNFNTYNLAWWPCWWDTMRLTPKVALCQCSGTT